MLKQSFQNEQCIALLYSKRIPQERQIIAETISKISNDPVLSEKIHLICTDNSYCQSHMRYNRSGILVPNTAVFLMKQKNRPTQIIPIESRETIFAKFVQPKSEIPLQEETQILSKNISWIPSRFPEDGSGQTIMIDKDDQLKFNSSDGSIHDVTESNSRWEPIQRLIPRQPNLNKTLTLTKPITYLICSVGHNSEVMRLKVVRDSTELPQRQDRTEEILEGILKYRSSKGDESESSPKYNIKKVTIKSKPQIVTMENGTKVKIVTKPKVIIPDDQELDQSKE